MRPSPIAVIACLAFGAAARADELDDARNLVRRGEHAAAAEKLKPLAEGGEEALLLLAEVSRRTGAYDEALRLLAGRSGAAALRSAEILIETGRTAEASALLAGEPALPRALLLQGDLAAHAGEPDRARAAWEATLPYYESMTAEELERSPPGLLIVFARALVGLNRFEEANEIMLGQALELTGGREDREVLLFAGELFASKYDFPEGRRYFRAARDRERRDPDALAGLARAIVEDPTQGGARLEEAVGLAREALAVNPRHERALMVLGDARLFDGDFAGALTHYRAALATNPACFEALGASYAAAHLTLDATERSKAEEAARRASKAPAAFYLAAARRCEIQCRYPTALSLARQAHDLDPTYWPAYTSLVLGELRAGQYENAAKLAAEGSAHDPFNIWLRNTRLLIDHWDEEYAVEPWDKLVFHAPRRTAPFYVAYIGPLLTQARQIFGERYGFTPEETIHVEVYPRQDYFATRVLGLPDFPAQGVCFGRVIALTVAPAFPGNHAVSAWHEFAHVFTVMGTDYRIPRWLTEGISVREEELCPAGGKRSFAVALGKAVAAGDVPTFSDFDRRFRRPRSVDELLTAYALAPVAVDFLLERCGHGVLPKLLGALKRQEFPAAFRAATGMELAAFDGAFTDKLTRMGSAAAEQFAGAGADAEALGAKVKAGTATPKESADLAWAHLGAGREIDAETLALKLRAANALPGEANAILGMIAYANGRNVKAEPALKEALEQKTRNAYNALVTLAAIAGKRKDGAAQAEYLARAWEGFPEFVAEAGDHGPLAELCKLWEQAKDKRLKGALADVVAYSRDAAWARVKLAEILRDEGDRTGEFKILSQLIFIVPFTGPDRLNVELFERLIASAEACGLPIEAARARKVIEACAK